MATESYCRTAQECVISSCQLFFLTVLNFLSSLYCCIWFCVQLLFLFFLERLQSPSLIYYFCNNPFLISPYYFFLLTLTVLAKFLSWFFSSVISAVWSIAIVVAQKWTNYHMMLLSVSYILFTAVPCNKACHVFVYGTCISYQEKKRVRVISAKIGGGENLKGSAIGLIRHWFCSLPCC